MTAVERGRFDDLYRSHYRAIVAYCRRRTQASSVDDAVAETFATAWRRIGDVPAGDVGKLWLYGVARKVLANQRRSTARGRRLKAKAEGTADTRPFEPALQLVQKAEYELVIRALRRLAPRDQEILRLSVWEELAAADIATVLDVGEGAVRQRLMRARRRLSEEYEKLNPGGDS